MIKRAFDIFLSSLGLFFSFPLWLLFSFAIWLEDRGPIFYLQDRVGKDGRIFKTIKFRSMIPDAERGIGPVQAQESDSRVTKIGKILRVTAMDELPQLVNIFKGDMSFVGPRALRPQEKEVRDNVTKSIFDFPEFPLRSKVRPGLTGIAQVFGMRNLTRQEKFEYDLWYIKNRTFFLDLYLILLSFLVTLKAKWETGEDKFNSLARDLKQRIERTTHQVQI